MHTAILGKVVAKWKLIESHAYMQRLDDKEGETQVLLALQNHQNCDRIPKLFNSTRHQREEPQGINTSIMVAYKMYDIHYWSKMLGDKCPPEQFWIDNIWQDVRNAKGETVVGGVPRESMVYQKFVREYHKTDPLTWEPSTHYEDMAGQPLSLFHLALRKGSWFNLAFTGNSHGNYAYYSLEDLYPHKIPALLEKYNKPSHATNKNFEEIAGMIPQAWTKCFDYMGVTHLKGSLAFDSNPENVYAVPISGRTSAGDRAPPQAGIMRHNVSPDVTVIASVNGKKMEQREFANKFCVCMVETAANGEVPKLPFQTVLSVAKPETHTVEHYMFSAKTSHDPWFEYPPEWGPPSKWLPDACKSMMREATGHAAELMSAIDSARTKARLFFIPHMTEFIINALVFAAPYKLMRGRIFKIGMKWRSGGAQKMAEQFKWRMSHGMVGSRNGIKMVYFEGDYRTLDAHIDLKQLERITYVPMYFYGKDRCSERDWECLCNLVAALAAATSVKDINVSFNDWRRYYGFMGSGDFKTSMGDSMAVAEDFFLWLTYMCAKFPQRQAAILAALRDGYIEFCVYGDDMILGVREDLADLVNMYNFKDWSMKFRNKEIRDVRQFGNFHSIICPITGEYLRRGPTFLQRGFVHRSAITQRTDLPEILPYRPTHKGIMKFAYGAKGGNRPTADYLLSTVGGIYDGMGTNHVLHDFYLFMHRTLSAMSPVSFHDITENLSEYMTPDSNITRLFRKAQITEHDIRRGMLSMDEMLDTHIYDEDKCRFDWAPAIEVY